VEEVLIQSAGFAENLQQAFRLRLHRLFQLAFLKGGVAFEDDRFDYHLTTFIDGEATRAVPAFSFASTL
jgi:hypothetical protein